MKLLSTILFFVINLFLSEKSISQPGALDKTFGTNGITTTDFYQNNDYGRSMAIQSDEKILLAGYSTDSLNKSLPIWRKYAALLLQRSVLVPYNNNAINKASKAKYSTHKANPAYLRYYGL
ncbi:MAG TPA: hypothetical protein VFW07_17560 [Parafilimonas sp.]|nr:hypothetical protein [Parafilimonas sp.]